MKEMGITHEDYCSDDFPQERMDAFHEKESEMAKKLGYYDFKEPSKFSISMMDNVYVTKIRLL